MNRQGTVARIEQTARMVPQQLVKLGQILEMNSSAVADKVHTEVEANPALNIKDGEEITDNSGGGCGTALEGAELGDTREEDEKLPSERKISDISNTDGSNYDDNDPEGRQQVVEGNEEVYTPHVVVEQSMHDYLMEQFGQIKGLTPRQMTIAEDVVGSLDEKGYLRDSVSDILLHLMCYGGSEFMDIKDEEVQEMVDLLRDMDPAGVGATDGIDCILLQLHQQKPSKLRDLAIEVMNDYADAFKKKHYERIGSALGIKKDVVDEVMEYIRKTCTPNPGAMFGGSQEIHSNQIVPDFEVRIEDGKLVLTMPNNIPELYVEESFEVAYEDYKKLAHRGRSISNDEKFVKYYAESAHELIELLKMRRETMLSIMRVILAKQKAFFMSGDERDLRPMVLNDVAERTGYDVSTVSRATNGKYVHTDFGTYSLKHFFSEGVSTNGDGEEISNKAVQKALREIIDGENKRHPLSDEALSKALSNRGYKVARRTVAKYRESMKIPVARLRKEL